MNTSLWLEDLIAATAFLALLSLAPAVLSLEKPAPPYVADEDAAWHLRHERNSAACRGQQYIAQCCDDARTDVTCIQSHIKGQK